MWPMAHVSKSRAEPSCFYPGRLSHQSDPSFLIQVQSRCRCKHPPGPSPDHGFSREHSFSRCLQQELTKESGRLAGISTDTVTKQAGHTSEEKSQIEHESEPLHVNGLAASTPLY